MLTHQIGLALFTLAKTAFALPNKFLLIIEFILVIASLFLMILNMS